MGNLTAARALQLLQHLLDVPAARNSKQKLELVLLEASLNSSTPQNGALVPAPVTAHATLAPTPATIPTPKDLTPSTPKPSATKIKPPEFKPETIQAPQPIVEAAPVLSAAVPTTDTSDLDITSLWSQTLDEIKKQYNTLYGIARMATVQLEGNKLTVSLKFAFHQKRMNEVKNRQIFSDVLTKLSGHPIEIYCIVAEKPTEVSKNEPDVAAISNIFGGAEVLES